MMKTLLKKQSSSSPTFNRCALPCWSPWIG